MLSDVTQSFLKLYSTKEGAAGPAFEVLVQRTYEAVLREGDTAIDCGANYGMHTIPMAKACGSTGRVHAFEPIAAAINGIRAKLEQQGLLERVELHQIALANENATLEFHYVPSEPALSSLRTTRHHANEKVVVERVQAKRLDDYYRGAPPRFIKMDVEGAEYHVFCGAKKLVRACRPIIVFENGRTESAVSFGYQRDDFFRLFNDIDYVAHFITGDLFEEADWQRHPAPWYYLATPRGSDEAQGLVNMLRARTRGFLEQKEDRS